jgi:hypothetical protein
MLGAENLPENAMTTRARSILAALLLGIAPLGVAVAGPNLGPVELRPAERPAAPALDTVRCFDAEFAWIYCDDQAQAAAIAADLREAAFLFHRHFGELPKRGAVVVTTNVGASAIAELRRAGAAWVMPWIPDSMLENIDLEGQIRAQVESQLKDRGFGDEMIEVAVEQALTQLGPRRRGIAGIMAQNRPLTHELGHFWFGQLIWGDAWMAPEAQDVGGGAGEGDRRGRARMLEGAMHRYGSPSPDWLDEVGAILLETPELTGRRHEHLTRQLAGDGTGIRPLSELFTMTHPGMENRAIQRAVREARQQADEEFQEGQQPQRGGAGVRVMPVTVLPGQGDMAELQGAGAFYAQCRSIAEYMMERSGDPRLFARIARDLKANPSMADWLAAHGNAANLPGTIEDLEQEWLVWARRRHLGDL